MKIPFPSTLVVLFSLVAPVAGFAQITFTVQATVNSAAMNYTSGQAVTFSFLLNNYAPVSPTGSTVASSFFEWKDNDLLTDPALWTSVSGTNLTGTWTRPATDHTSPLSTITAYAAAGQLSLFAGTDSANDTGMMVNGAGLKDVTLWGTYTGLNFSPVTGALIDPTTYFNNYLGTYAATATTFASVTNGVGGQVFLTINSLTISAPAAVPEPASVAALLGGLVLFLGCLRRRAVKQA